MFGAEMVERLAQQRAAAIVAQHRHQAHAQPPPASIQAPQGAIPETTFRKEQLKVRLKSSGDPVSARLESPRREEVVQVVLAAPGPLGISVRQSCLVPQWPLKALVPELGGLGRLQVGVRTSNRDGSSHAVLLHIDSKSQAGMLSELRPGLVLREINGQPVATFNDHQVRRECVRAGVAWRVGGRAGWEG
jgi:hypothetical protein